MSIHRLTDVPSVSQGTNATNATTRPTADEADYPFLLGANYVGTIVHPLDIAFVGMWPRLLSADEMQQMRASIGKRMAAYGVAI